MHWYVRGLSFKPNIYVSWSTTELWVMLANRSLFLFGNWKKKLKWRQIDFLSFTLNPEVRSSSEMFVITKWTNKVLFC